MQRDSRADFDSLLDREFQVFLSEAGLSSFASQTGAMTKKIYHDLGVYGEEAEFLIELLEDRFDVDTAEFVFDDFFPREFFGNSLLVGSFCAIFPFLRSRLEASQVYRELTLADVKRAIRVKAIS